MSAAAKASGTLGSAATGLVHIYPFSDQLS
jgi:hypothetical protein